MKPSASDLDSINDLNAVVLKEEELFEVIDAYRRTRGIGLRRAMKSVISEKKVYEETPDKAEAILFRLQALSMMMENNELSHWVLDEGTSVMPAIANRALVSAAAEHPLSLIDGDIAFEKESFLRRILELAEPEGSDSN